MNKKEILMKVAVSNTTKLTALGLGIGAIPGVSELIRARIIKDPELKERVKDNAIKRLSIGVPVGGFIGYGVGKVIKRGKNFFDIATKAVENKANLDIENINKTTKNLSEVSDIIRHPFKNIKAALSRKIGKNKK